MTARVLLIISLLSTLLVSPLIGGSKVTLKWGSLAPEGTPFYDIIHQINNEWQEMTQGSVKMKIYAGGIAGAEPDMIRKMKIGQLHGASMSITGLALIDRSVNALQMPCLIRSEEELSYYLTGLKPLIEERFEKQGYIPLCYTNLGKLYFFTTKKTTSIEELKKMKLCTFSTEKNSKAVWLNAGFTVINVNSSEVLAALQTGMLDGFIHSPLYALSMQWFAKAKYMIEVNYGYGLAASVITKKKWDKIDPQLQPQLLAAAEELNKKNLIEINKLNEKAIPTMKQYGLEVYSPPKEEEYLWIESLMNTYPQVKGNLIPDDVYEKMMALRKSAKTKK
ncbi:MAG: TRAP transporter substrate-binding protein DctP [Fibrobacteria bacterium]|nr:TRAP transporter substrate-binding protein DctP [Fibrobacteria bacterium]